MNQTERAGRSGPIPYWGANGIVDYVDEHLFDEQLVLLGEDGAPFDKPLADVAFTVSGRTWINNHIHALRVQPSTEPRFLTYSLNSTDWMPLVTGATRLKLTQDAMLQAAVMLPPIRTQRAIADFLDTETARIDALIAKKRHMIELLDERGQSSIDAAIGVCEPVVSLRRLVSRLTSGPRGWSERTGEVGQPFIRITNISGRGIELDRSDLLRVEDPDTAESRRTSVNVDDILVSITANIGSVAVARKSDAGGFVSQHVALMTPSGCEGN